MALKTFKKRRKIDIPRVRICHDIFVKSIYIYIYINMGIWWISLELQERNWISSKKKVMFDIK